jgi:hypothetical protein
MPLKPFPMIARPRLAPWFPLMLFLLMGSAWSPVEAEMPEVSGMPEVDNRVTFERQVRPLLRTHCFHCHGEAGRVEGGLDLRMRRLIVAGGDSGPAIEAGEPEASWLFQRVESGEMPPPEIEHRVTAAEVATLRQWIEDGGETLRPEPDVDPDDYLTEEERNFWSFRPVVRVDPPEVDAIDRVRTPIDRFIIAKLESAGLALSEDADRVTLIRRATMDLWGLPPSPEEVEQFLADLDPGAFERLIDRLLASPHYGERWGRHWLDLAGYADSEGYTDDDILRADAYRYRDYVIRSLNANKPLDRFVIEQLAGDELAGPPYRNLSEEQIEQLTATGFLRMVPDGTGARGVEQDVARNDVIAATIEQVTSSLLGLTVACAQCHDHRYDPIPHTDYFAVRSLFEPALNWKDWQTPAQRRLSLSTDADQEEADRIEEEAKALDQRRAEQQQKFIDEVFEKQLALLPEEVREETRQARLTSDKERTPEQQELLKKYPSVNVTASSLYLYDKKAADELKRMADEASALRQTKPKEEFLRVLREPEGTTPPETFLFYRGDPSQPRQSVAPRELQVLAPTDLEIPVDDPHRATTGRRLAYAEWLVSGEHPLAGRVLANRIWLLHFGQGIVATPADFGFLGTPPSHPELLDWLASELAASGWDLKRMHRLIMTSSVYRQSSLRNQQAEPIDGENRLHWRMPPRRLEAEVLRDSLLRVSGELNTRAFGPPVPVMADPAGQFVVGIENLNAGRPGPVIPMQGEDLRRSVYIQVRRSRPLSILDPFDPPELEPNCTLRSVSTVAPQSLLLMNSEFVLERADQLARQVQRQAGDSVDDQLRLAWRIALAHEPSEQDLSEAKEFLLAQARHFAVGVSDGGQAAGADQSGEEPPGEAEEESQAAGHLQALASFCHALFSSNGFLYID